MPITPFDYHNNPENHGSYQYVPLKKIVDGFVLDSMDDDSIIKNTRRYRILQKTKDAIQELSKQVSSDILTAELTVPENLSLALPHDFVDYVRVSLVIWDETTNSYRLQPLNINYNINTAVGYLQDHNAEILFDNNGGILTADALNGYNKPYKKYSFVSGSCSNAYKDTSKLSRFGEFKIDKQRGKILFSSDLTDKEIVIEYLSDGLSWDTYAEDRIKVHKNVLQVVKDLTYFYIIEHKRNIAQNEKYRALLRYKTTRREARLEQANFDFLYINRMMRIKSKS